MRGRERAAEIEAVLARFQERLLPEDRALAQVRSVTALARKGIGYHHAGLLPVLKQLVEELFGRGLMSVVFSTDTLALGINMPARSVVIGRMSKYDGQSVRPLRPNELQQMAGRAGRRGIDVAGYVVIPYSPWLAFSEAMNIALGDLYPVESSFALRYNTVLNLWDPPDGDRVLFVLRQSLMQFQMGRRVRELSAGMGGWQERLDAVPRGCLVGLEDGEALLKEHQELTRSRVALERRRDELRRERSFLEARLGETPWRRPTREQLRKLLRSIAPGALLHTDGGGWGVYAGRGADGAIRLLQDRALLRLQGYSGIDYYPSSDLRVEMPAPLREATSRDNVSDVLATDWREMERDVEALDLPDLREWTAKHRERIAASVRGSLETLAREEEANREALRALGERTDAHPCEPCLVRKQHLANLREADRVRDQRIEAERELERRVRQEEERAQGVLRGIVSVLHRFGYLERGQPTDKADSLANVFDTNGLLLCEVIAMGVLDRLSPADLAEVFSWFAYDRDRQFQNKHVLPPHLVNLRGVLAEVQGRIIRAESRAGFTITEGHNAYFFGMMRAWCNGMTLGTVLERVELSEGDLVLTFNKAVDLMRQVREMLRETDRTSPLVAKLETAMRMARRGIIEQSYAVGFGIEPPPPDASDEEVEALITGGELAPQ